MTKFQAGIAVVGVALLAGGASVYYRCSLQEEVVPVVAAAPQLIPGTPRSVVYDLLKGMREGNSELVRQAVYARDEHETQAVETLMEYGEAANRLNIVGDAKFGPERLRPLGLPLSRTTMAAQVAGLNEVVDGDLADVDLYPTANPSVFHLRKIEGRWRVMIRETFDPGRAEETGPLTGMIEALRLQTRAYSLVCRDIENGKLATLPAAQFAMNSRLSEAYRGGWGGFGRPRSATTVPVPDLP